MFSVRGLNIPPLVMRIASGDAKRIAGGGVWSTVIALGFNVVVFAPQYLPDHKPLPVIKNHYG